MDEFKAKERRPGLPPSHPENMPPQRHFLKQLEHMRENPMKTPPNTFTSIDHDAIYHPGAGHNGAGADELLFGWGDAVSDEPLDETLARITRNEPKDTDDR